jgi:PAS domain-containing protein
MTPPSSTTDERPERIARLAQTLAEVAALKPHELTPQQRVALHDLADLAQGEVQRTEEALPSVPSSPRGVAAARRLVLTIFGVARAFIADSHELVQARAAAAGSAAESPLVAAKSALVAEEAERLSGMMIVSGVARAVVLLLALFLIFRSLAAREKAEVELMSSRDAALSAAEARRVAQAEAEKLGERLRAVLDHIDVGVLMIESDGTITVYNMAAERIHGAWREQMERLKQAGAMTPMLADEKTVIPPGESPMGRALKGETVRDAHVFFRTPFRPNGYHLNVSAAPLRSHLGLLTGAVLMFSERRPEQPLGK